MARLMEEATQNRFYQTLSNTLLAVKGFGIPAGALKWDNPVPGATRAIVARLIESDFFLQARTRSAPALSPPASASGLAATAAVD